MLRGFPETLAETYAEILCSLEPDYVDDARKILRFLCYANRPVSLVEVAEILTIDWEDKPFFDPDNRPLEPSYVLQSCASMVSFSTSLGGSPLSEIKLAHASVKDFLTTSQDVRFGTLREWACEKTMANHFIAETCLAYILGLDYDYDGTEDAERPFAGYAARFWLDHVRETTWSSSLNQLCRDLFRKASNAYLNWCRLFDLEKPWEHGPRDLTEEPAPSPIYLATRSGLKELVRDLLVAGPELNTREGKLGTALNAAAYIGDEDILKLLLDYGALSAENASGWGRSGSPLMTAVERGHSGVAELLLSAGCSANEVDYKQNTVLHRALYANNEGLVKLLLEHGASPTRYGIKSEPPLDLATRNRSISTLNLLVQHGAKISPENVYRAAQMGNKEALEFFLTKVDIPKDNLLLAAAEGNLVDFVGKLISDGVNVNGIPGHGVRKNQDTPLIAAIRNNSVATVKKLLMNGANPNLADSHGETALFVACNHGVEASITTTLLEHGANVNAKDKKGTTPLQRAVGGGSFPEFDYTVTSIEVTNVLLHNDPPADIYASDGPHGTVLQAAAGSGSTVLVQKFLDLGIDIDACAGTSRPKSTALDIASIRGHRDIVTLLLKRGANPNGSSALIPGNKSTLCLAAQNYDDYQMEDDSSGRSTANDIIESLLRAGASIDSLSGTPPRTALQIAVMKDKFRAVKLLISHGSNVNANGGALCYAVEEYQESVEMLELLLSHGANPTSVGYEGQDSSHEDVVLPQSNPPLFLTAARPYFLEAIRLLIRAGAEVNGKNPEGWTALHIASKVGNDDAVDDLVRNHGANIHLRIPNGSKALDIAAQNNKVNCVKQLLDYGSDINSVDKKGRTALHAAIDNGRGWGPNVEIAFLLLDRGADLGIRDESGTTPYDLAESLKLAATSYDAYGFRKIIQRMKTILGIILDSEFSDSDDTRQIELEDTTFD